PENLATAACQRDRTSSARRPGLRDLISSATWPVTFKRTRRPVGCGIRRADPPATNTRSHRNAATADPPTPAATCFWVAASLRTNGTAASGDATPAEPDTSPAATPV